MDLYLVAGVVSFGATTVNGKDTVFLEFTFLEEENEIHARGASWRKDREERVPQFCR